MARYSDTREEKVEAKYLYKVWSKVDSGIELPPSLTGRALLPKLDHLEQPVPLTRKIRFSPRIFTWQSGVTYAAAFLLIVALSAVFGRNSTLSSDSVQEPQSVAEAADESDENAATFAAQPRVAIPEAEEEAEADVEAGAGVSVQDAPSQTSPAPEKAEAFSAGAADGMDEGVASSSPEFEGIGGQSESILLGQDDTYTYTYRANDPTDPDKAGYPVTVNIMDTASGALVCAIDISDMQSVEEYYRYENALALVGLAEGGVAFHSYDLSAMEEPVETFAHTQPGKLLGARLYKNVVHVLTLADAGDPLDCEVIELLGSTADTSCLITAIDMDTLETNQKAFSGAGDDVALYNLNVYLNYTGEATEDNETGRYGAHIRLDGMEIELGNNT